MTRYAIQGFATRYRKAYIDENGICALMPGCFSSSIRSGQEIHFLRDHDGARRVGSTMSGLTLYDCEDGLAFRLEAPPASVLDAVRSGHRRSMSIGITIGKHEKVRADGVEFNLIRKADLGEISLVHRPAISNTCVSVVDLDETGTLQHCVDSGALALLGASTALSNAVDDFCSMATEKLDEGAALMRDLVAYARGSSRSASRGQRRAKRRRMPIIDMSFARNAFINQPGARREFAQLDGDNSISDYINHYCRRAAL